MRIGKRGVIIGAAFFAGFIGAISMIGLLRSNGGGSLEPRNADYYETYGLWEVACDNATDGSDKRCYAQYVDVYEPQPNLKAAMVHLVYHKKPNSTDVGTGAPELTFNMERGLSLASSDVVVRMDDSSVSFMDVSHCTDSKCVFEGKAAQNLLDLLSKGRLLSMTVKERDGERTLEWPLDAFSKVLDDLATQRIARDLP